MTAQRPSLTLVDANRRDDVAESLDAMRRGDADALAACYRAHARAMCTVALRFTGSLPDAEDVVHDVFAGLSTALHLYEERGQFRAWLTRLTIRASLMHQRRERRRRHEALDTHEAQQSMYAPTVDGDHAAAARILDALRALTEPLRHVFVLRAVHELPHAEIATLLGISIAASEVRMHRAVKQLRDHLEDVR